MDFFNAVYRLNWGYSYNGKWTCPQHKIYSIYPGNYYITLVKLNI